MIATHLLIPSWIAYVQESSHDAGTFTTTGPPATPWERAPAYKKSKEILDIRTVLLHGRIVVQDIVDNIGLLHGETGKGMPNLLAPYHHRAR